MGKPFESEIAYLPEAIKWACSQDVKHLERIVWSLSAKSLLAIGSGGSFSAACFIANRHEELFGQASRAMTPLEFVTHPSSWADVGVGLISAEGKNQDILAAARRRAAISLSGFVLTLRQSNPLIDFCTDAGACGIASFEMPWGKDGFLATNSLVATLVLIGKVYAQDMDAFLKSVNSLDTAAIALRRAAITSQIDEVRHTIDERILILHGYAGWVGATDMESKLAESALAFAQVVDFRQFAHGRHIQLISQTKNPLVVVLISDRDRTLASKTMELIPKNVSVVALELPSDPVTAGVVGVLDSIFLTNAIANHRGIDPGQPSVAQFARDLYGLAVEDQRSGEREDDIPAVRRKLGSGRLDADVRQIWSDAAMLFCDRLSDAAFKALICDFDGTFCDTHDRFNGLDIRLVPHLTRLAEAGALIVFATGRGDSLFTDLQKKLPVSIRSQVLIGYYSGSVIEGLATQPSFGPHEPLFDELVGWLNTNGILHRIGIDQPRANCGQLSLRIRDQRGRTTTLEAIRKWVADTAPTGWRVYCSGHSIDVLSSSAGKKKVVEHVARLRSCDAASEILRIGDAGDFEGNDFELLNEGIGLSVGAVSPSREVCWNLLPHALSEVAGTLHYLGGLEVRENAVAFAPQFIANIRNGLTA